MIKILITGPEQSGSTRIYNFLRILLEKLKLNILFGWDIEIPNKIIAKLLYLLKI